jgi:hypothetical protein
MKPCIGRCVFWALIIAILFARAIFARVSRPVTAGLFDRVRAAETAR